MRKVFVSFEDLYQEIKQETDKQAHVIDVKLNRARYLIEEKRRLHKRLDEIDGELESMGDREV